MTRERCASPSVDDVVAATATAFDVTVDELRGPTRNHPLPEARAIVAVIARDLPSKPSYPAIGRALRKDHASVIAAERRGREALRVGDGGAAQRRDRALEMLAAPRTTGGATERAAWVPWERTGGRWVCARGSLGAHVTCGLTHTAESAATTHCDRMNRVEGRGEFARP